MTPVPFRVVGTETVATAGFLALERRRVEGPDGVQFDRHVVRHPGAVVVVPIDPDGGALLVRQFRVAAGRELLEVPAGKRDVEGEAPAETAARELEEEIGRRPGALELLAEFYNSPGFCDEYTHLYLATDLTVTERGAVTAEEAAMMVEAVSLESVPALVAAHDIVDAKTIVGLLLARERLAGAG